MSITGLIPGVGGGGGGGNPNDPITPTIVSTDTTAAQAIAIDVSITHTPDADSAGSSTPYRMGERMLITIPGESTHSTRGLQAAHVEMVDAGSGNMGIMHGFDYDIEKPGTGTTGSVRGGNFYVAVYDGSATVLEGFFLTVEADSPAVISDMHGVRLNLDSFGATVTNRSAILIDPMDGTPSGTDYAIESQATQPSVLYGPLAIGNGASIKKHLSGTVAWTPTLIASASYLTKTVTVTGAALGDTVAVGYSVALAAGLIISGQVTAANTVTVTIINLSGSGVTPGAGTVRADVWQH
jgi:hypothetical protein